MRFARHATIFRGPLEAAPVIGVLFLLVIFLLLGSLLYTPGVLVRFDQAAGFASAENTILVTHGGDVIFEGKTNTVADLDQLRRSDLKTAPLDHPLVLKLEPGAPASVVDKVKGLFPIQLPTGDYMEGTDNPTIVVAVNFRGQYFYGSRLMHEPELRVALRDTIQQTAHDSKKLTMVLWADKAAENAVIMRLYRIGREAGITEFLLAEQPPVFGPNGTPRL